MRILLVTSFFIVFQGSLTSASANATAVAQPLKEQPALNDIQLKQITPDPEVDKIVHEFTTKILKSLSPEQIKTHGFTPFLQVIEDKKYSFRNSVRATYLVENFVKSKKLVRTLEDPTVQKILKKGLFRRTLDRYSERPDLAFSPPLLADIIWGFFPASIGTFAIAYSLFPDLFLATSQIS